MNRSVARIALYLFVFLIILPTDVRAQSGSSGSIFLDTRLTVRTVPTGATVFLDGRERGTTPLVGESVRAGRRRLTVEYRGYDTIDEWIDLPAGEDVEFEYTIRPRVYNVILATDTDSPLELYLNGTWQSTNEVQLRPGSYDLRARAFGYAPVRVPIELPPFGTSTDAPAGGAGTAGTASIAGTPGTPDTADIAANQPLEVTFVVPLRTTTNPDPAVSVLDSTIAPGGKVRLSVESQTSAILRVAVIAQGSASTVPIYASEQTIVQRRTIIEWQGITAMGNLVPPGAYDLSVTVSPLADGQDYSYTVPVRVEEPFGVTPFPVTTSGFGSSLVPLPFVPLDRSVVLTVSGGVSTITGDQERTDVPLSVRLGAVPIRQMTFGATGHITVSDAYTEPGGGGTVAIGTTAISLGTHVSTALHAGISLHREDETPWIVEYRGDAPFAITTRNVLVALVPGVNLSTGDSEHYPSDPVAVAGAVIAIRRREIFSGVTARVMITDRTYDNAILEQYALDFVYAPSSSPVRLQSAFKLVRSRPGVSISGEIGIGFAIGNATTATYTGARER